jgi:hypothetical protein
MIGSFFFALALLQSPSVQRQLGKPSMSDTGLLNSGMIVFIDSGSCPTNWTEVSQAGNYVLLTSSGNGNVGTTGGSNSYTPAGSNATASFTPSGTVAAPTFTGSQGTVPAETFTGTPFSSVINHTHTVTVTSLVQGGTTAATTGTHLMTSTAVGGSARAPTAGGVASITPAGINGTASFTPAGTNSAPTFTGNSGTVPAETWSGTPTTIQPTFIRLIACKKT